MSAAADPVNPDHYRLGGIEVIDAIEAWGLGYHLGNVVKYVARAGRKDPARHIEDLKKARWYLDREIERETARQSAHSRHASEQLCCHGTPFGACVECSP